MQVGRSVLQIQSLPSCQKKYVENYVEHFLQGKKKDEACVLQVVLLI
jgi:hypothetical protein